MPASKSLDEKLRSIHSDPSGSKEFIIADAKDADMAFGMSAPGTTTAPSSRPKSGANGGSPESHASEVRLKTLAEYRDQIRQVIDQGVVDIVLMSASTSDQLAVQEKLFENSRITPAARANDASDVHLPRGGKVHAEPARPFRTAHLDHMQCGHLDCAPDERLIGSNLGLYSVTFLNDQTRDLETLQRYKEFREEAERTLAGVPRAGRPVFLKIVYHGPQAMEELVQYDPHLVVGVLGGAAGTTLDAFQLLHQSKKYGGRAALFGRKINSAENQLAFIEFLRLIADGVIEPEEAVRAYHSVLSKLGVAPHRPLDVDLTLQTNVMSYGGSGTTISIPAAAPTNGAASKSNTPQKPTPLDKPDFAKMSPDERLAYHRERLRRALG